MSALTIHHSDGSESIISGYIGEYKYLDVATPPEHTLAANGAEVSKALYPELYAVIGDRHGTPANPDNFVLPDHRGVVARGLDGGRGLDAGRELGTYQDDAIRNITGAGAALYRSIAAEQAGALWFAQYGSSPSKTGTIGVDQGDSVSIYFDASLVVPTAAENRMRNISVLAVIVYE